MVHLTKNLLPEVGFLGGVPNLAPSLSFGNILIIDNGSGAGFALGRGSRNSGGANQLDDFLVEF